MCLAETGQRKTSIVDQLAQDHPQVVLGAARHCVDRVTQRALEPVQARRTDGCAKLICTRNGWRNNSPSVTDIFGPILAL